QVPPHERQPRARRSRRVGAGRRRPREAALPRRRRAPRAVEGSRRAGPPQGRTRSPDLRRLMPKIQWTDLPHALREHLFDRVRERKIAAEDLYALKLWRETQP